MRKSDKASSLWVYIFVPAHVSIANFMILCFGEVVVYWTMVIRTLLYHILVTGPDDGNKLYWILVPLEVNNKISNASYSILYIRIQI